MQIFATCTLQLSPHTVSRGALELPKNNILTIFWQRERSKEVLLHVWKSLTFTEIISVSKLGLPRIDTFAWCKMGGGSYLLWGDSVSHHCIMSLPACSRSSSIILCCNSQHQPPNSMGFGANVKALLQCNARTFRSHPCFVVLLLLNKQISVSRLQLQL